MSRGSGADPGADPGTGRAAVLRGNASRHGPVARAFHWLTAVLFLSLVALGAWMTELDYYDQWQPLAIRTHRAVGIATLALVAARLLWRAWDTRPPPHPGLAHWERRLSIRTHWFLLAALVLLPVTGYLFSTSKGGAVPLVAGLEVPVLVEVSKGTAERIYTVHKVLAYAALAAVGLHVAGAVKHALEGNSEVLRRML